MDANQKPNYCELVMDFDEANDYTGAIWREVRADELEEVARYYAEDEISSERRVFGEEMDTVEFQIRVEKRIAEAIEEYRPLIRVLDLVKLNIQIFHVFSLSISRTKVTNELFLEDGMSKLLKKDGVFTDLSLSDEILFNF